MPKQLFEGSDLNSEPGESFWDGVGTPTAIKEFRLLNCHSCHQSLRVPTAYAGTVSCPKCLVKLSTENTEPKEKRKTGFFAGIIGFILIDVFAFLFILPIAILLSVLN